MADTRTREQRRRIMQSVGTKNTGPEWTVRRLLHAAGYRYRLHARDLPGKPDLVFRKRQAAVFVHGCFWHWHGCSKGQPPKSKLDYWQPKLEANRLRDERQRHQLEELGWSVLTVWQCETKDEDALLRRLVKFLGNE
jgi:DNA mismatch endonuclease (patch repair protein)